MTSVNKPKVLFACEEIETAVNRLAGAVRRDYKDKYPVLISILKGSFMFIAGLIRQLDFLLEVESIRLSSYGKGRKSSGKISVVQGLHFPTKNRGVLIVKDTSDTGKTLSFIVNYFRRRKPASLKLCALADKP